MMSKIKNIFYVSLLRFLLKFGVDKGNKHILDIIKSDLYRETNSSDLRVLFKSILNSPNLQFLFFFRLASTAPKSFFRKKVHAFSYNFHKKYFFKYGFQIPIETTIGKGVQFLHFGNIVFNSASIIGNNCTIAQGVLIGQSNRGVPKIGNCVWIGANAILVGGITIGNNVLIAPGAYVNIDIPENSLVIGNPCTVLPKKPSIIDGYIVNKVNV